MLFCPHFQIRKMDLEARSLPPNVKATLLAKLREYKSDLNNLKTEVKRITSGNANQAARDELLESGMADANMVIPFPYRVFKNQASQFVKVDSHSLLVKRRWLVSNCYFNPICSSESNWCVGCSMFKLQN